MPQAWVPKSSVLWKDIAEEEARLAELAEKQGKPAEYWSIAPVGEPTPVQSVEPSPPTLGKFPPQEQGIEPSPQVDWIPPSSFTRSSPISPQPQVTFAIPKEAKETALWEKPKEWGETLMGKVGEALSKVPGMGKAMKFVAPAFEFISEKLEKPWAATLTALLSPSLPWQSGESWLDHQKREYEAWQAPTYFKGFAEFLMPLWWIPWIGWTGKGARALMGAGRAAKFAKAIPKAGREVLVPTFEEFNSLLPDNFMKKAALFAENKPIINKLVEIAGGPAAFARKNPVTDAQKALNMFVYRGALQDMGENVVRAQMPDLFVKLGGKTEVDLLKLHGGEIIKGKPYNQLVGAVTTDAEHAGVKMASGGVSYFYHDVLQNPNLYKWTDKAAFDYVKTAHEIAGWFDEFGRANGLVDIGVKRGVQVVGDIIQYHIPRMAKGLKSPEGKLLELGTTDPFKPEIYNLMAEGVEKGVLYSGTLTDAVALLGNATARRIARVKFQESVRGLGETLISRFERTSPEIATEFSSKVNRVRLLTKATEELADAMPKGGMAVGKVIHGSTINSIGAEFTGLAAEMAGLVKIRPLDVVNYIKKMSKSSQLIVEKQRKPLIEALLAQPQRTTYYDVIYTVTKFTKNEEQAIRLVERIYKQSARGEAVEYKTAVRNLVDKAKKMLDTEKVSLKLVSTERRLKLRQLQASPARGEAAFTRAGLGGRVYPEAVVKMIEPRLRDIGQEWIRKTGILSRASVTLTATLDLSAPWIQGLMVFGSNPVAWALSVGKMLKIVARPKQLYVELAARKASILERATYGGSIGMFDFFEAMPLLKAAAGKIAGGKGERIIRETYGRAEASFIGFGEIARDEMWKVGKFMMGKRGLKGEAMEVQLRELARTLDRMTGVMSPAALGIGLTQQQVESGWVFFAPRYTRAGLSFFADMFQGGFSGAEARKAMMGWLLGGTTNYMAIMAVTGQEPNFNPLSARFMTVKVGDRYVGIGGIYYAMMRMMANTVATGIEERALLSPLNLSRVDQPFYKFLYSRAAPLTGLTVGLAIEHKNYLGEPFEDAKDYAAFLADKVTPIAMQTLMPWDRKPYLEEGIFPPAAGAEILGARTFPISAWEARDIVRNNIATKNYKKEWKELTRAEQRNLELDYPVIIKYNEEAQRVQKLRGKPDDILFNNWQDEIDQNKESRDMRIWNVARAAERTGDYYAFREAIGDIENDYAAILQHISSNKAYSPVMKILEDASTKKDLSQMQLNDAAYSEWSSFRYSKEPTPFGLMEDAFGEPDWGAVDKLREYIADKYGDSAMQYIEQERPLSGRNLPPLYLELRKAQQVLRPYWEVKSKAIKMFGKPRTPSQEARVKKVTQRIREMLRRTNPQIARYFNLFYRQKA